ncbi:hypothetical protein [Paraburkholderia acidisoli]|uniref:Uncharacterized protein n=1 Tax=Paraburkholderia acidisoli TaxID=2571748 RepID=A0A7Z2GIK8_9BURK|nr:hypothetical protein [Paraburkholderia acidisoli]QGZ62447.1 hypothetical protein FAZ98_12320 [Paraburkholderia acidisoli]
MKFSACQGGDVKLAAREASGTGGLAIFEQSAGRRWQHVGGAMRVTAPGAARIAKTAIVTSSAGRLDGGFDDLLREGFRGGSGGAPGRRGKAAAAGCARLPQRGAGCADPARPAVPAHPPRL